MMRADMVARKLENFLIDPDLAAGLELVKQRDGIAKGEQIRRAIRAWLESKRAIKAERQRVAARKRS